MENVEKIISRNICKYRKRAKLTQSELAEQLNFSDKSISKWERGDALPDVVVLINMCEIFGITLNDIVCEEIVQPMHDKVVTAKRNHAIISIISAVAVWLACTLAYVCMLIFVPSYVTSWLLFIYAIPASVIVLLVFACIWGRWWYKFALMSVLMWTSVIGLCLTFNSLWNLLYVCIPMQCLCLLWALLEWNIRRKSIGKLNVIQQVKENKKRKKQIKTNKDSLEDKEDILLNK